MSGNEPSNVRQFIAAFTATLLPFSAGTAIGWTSPTLPLLRTHEKPFLTMDEASWVGSLLTVGAFLGSLPAGKLTDALGRKKIMLLLVLPVSLSWGILLFSTHVWGLYLGRFIGGFTIGIMSVAAPTYVNEISTPSLRGTLGTLYQLQFCIGVTAMYLIGLLPTVFIMTLFCSLLPNIFLATFIWMPESPQWLLTKGRHEDSRKAIKWLRGSKYDVDGELASKRTSIAQGGLENVGILSVFEDAVSRKGIFLIVALMFFQQFSGVNVVVFYAHIIFSLSGSSIPPSTGSILLSLVAAIATIVAAGLMDSAGRRSLLILSCVGSGLCLLGLGGFVLYVVNGSGDPSSIEATPSSIGWIPLFCLGAFGVVFSLGLGPIPWIMMGELFPEKLKASASVVGAATSWGLAFLTTRFVMNVVEAIGFGFTLWLFAGCCALGAVFTIFFVTETKGKTTEEILIELGAIPGAKNNSDDVAV